MINMSDILVQIRAAVETAIAESKCEVTPGSAGHFVLTVTASAFQGQSRLQQQRMVLSAIAHLMKGDGAPVHAVDSLTTRLP